MNPSSILLALCGLLLWSATLPADDQAVADRVQAVITAAGGEEKLLKLFRFRERVIVGDVIPPPVAENEPGNRTSVVEVPDSWWIGTAKREKEKTRVLVWAWTLRLLIDPKSKVEVIEDAEVHGIAASGLRVMESIKEPLDLFFNKKDQRLVAIDFDDTRHVFSEWKKTADGYEYPSRVVGFRFEDRAKRTLQMKQWYQTDLLELTPLKELPADLLR